MNSLIMSGGFILSIFGSPVYVSTEPIPIPIETIEQRIDRVATAHSIATTTLYNLVMSESSLNPEIKDGDMDILCNSGPNLGKPVRSRGIAQISECYHPEISDDEAYSPEWSLNYVADKIAKGTIWREHMVCNCYTYAKTKIKGLPAMKDIQPNTPYPIVGGLLIEYFNKVKHISVITKITKEGIYVSQTNKVPCKFTKELRPFNNPNREGYWRANQ
jgi:hypothetical protein